MPLNDVTVEMKCFDLSQMSLNPSVTNFKTSQGFCSSETGGVINAEVESMSSTERLFHSSITHVFQRLWPKLLPV